MDFSDFSSKDVLVWRLATLTSKSLTLALPSSSLSWVQDGIFCWYIGTVFLVQKSEESPGEVGSSSDYLQFFLLYISGGAGSLNHQEYVICVACGLIYSFRFQDAFSP